METSFKSLRLVYINLQNIMPIEKHKDASIMRQSNISTVVCSLLSLIIFHYRKIRASEILSSLFHCQTITPFEVNRHICIYRYIQYMYREGHNGAYTIKLHLFQPLLLPRQPSWDNPLVWLKGQ